MINGKKVVITGCGVLTTIGDTLEKYWFNLCEGNNGYGPLTGMNTDGYATNIGGEILDFRPERYIPDFEKKKNFLGKTSQLAISASYLALSDAGIKLEELDGLNAGVVMGTTDGEPVSVEKMDLKLAGQSEELDRVAVSLMPPYRISYSIAREFNITGPVSTVASACAASNHAIGLAWEQIMTGSADIMIVGGADSFSRKTFTGFNRLGATGDCCRPFGHDRAGMIPSEGAGVVILESLERAIKRNASIYAEVAGCGASCDAYHMTLLNEDGIALAMQNALQNSGIRADQINLICAHGTGTRANDPAEANVINKIYGSQVPVTANKSVLGHTMGAASVLNVITLSLAMRKKIIPKTSNVEKLDPACQVNCVLENIHNVNIDYGQSNGFAFGGNNGIVILKNGELI